jgi:putative spermidine/putrescine transport system ATP-binding protein
MTAVGLPLQVRDVSHGYGGVSVLDRVSFDVPGGTIAALLGPSGCGKTTILRAVAGFLRPRHGTMRLGGETLDPLPARHRRIGMVFQSYALFPHLTVRENVGYGLWAAGVPRRQRQQRVDEMLALVRLSDYGDRLPRQLSGGQQQRIAVARALAPAPRLLLLDEPFAALDKDLRLDLQIELVRLQRSLSITTILVTHDQEEALSVADRLIVMDRGRIEQIGAPSDVYDRPASLFVNRFVGKTTLLAGKVTDPAAGLIAIAGCGEIRVPAALSFIRGADVAVTVRPEKVLLVPPGQAGAWPAVLSVRLPLGPNLLHEVVLADGTRLKSTQTRTGDDPPWLPGEPVGVAVQGTDVYVFPAPPTDSPSPARVH